MNNGNNLHAPEIEIYVTSSKKGDSDAFAKIYDIFVNAIYRYMHYRVGPQDAEDLTEIVFLKTWENIQQYRPRTHQHNGKRPPGFSSWIFRIAHNVVVDFYRSNHDNEELAEDLQDERVSATAQDRAHRHFDQTLLSAAMRELKDSYRQILILKYMNDFSNEEIAEILGRSKAALRILQFRALKNLRRILENKGIHEF